MTPRTYVDLRIVALGGDARASGADPRAAGLVFSVLHRYMRQHPQTYATAFPEGHGFLGVIRVFASSRPELDQLAEVLLGSPLVRDYALLGYPREVPDDFQGPWLQYRRFRIPTRRADRHDGAPCRARRLAEAERKHLPYLLVHSASTGQSFGLRFEVLPGEANTTPCRPDSYGLARRESAFSVPALRA